MIPSNGDTVGKGSVVYGGVARKEDRKRRPCPRTKGTGNTPVIRQYKISEIAGPESDGGSEETKALWPKRRERNDKN